MEYILMKLYSNVYEVKPCVTYKKRFLSLSLFPIYFPVISFLLLFFTLFLCMPKLGNI